MSGWDGKEIVRLDPKPIEGHPNWWAVDCGCCRGIMWGGDEPRECDDCGATGWLAVHRPSGVLADYPGGPLRGHAELADLRAIDRMAS